MKRATTISDIARECGVSRWTVSAILCPSKNNRHSGYSEDTRELVLAAAKRLRYRPQRHTRCLRSSRHGVLGIMTANSYLVSWEMLHAMLREARSANQLLSIETFVPGDANLPLFIRENVVDGLILFETLPAVFEEAIAYHQIPAVYVNACRHGSNAINMDEAGAISSLVTRFAQAGRTRVGLIGQYGEVTFDRERQVALRRVCTELRLPAPRVCVIEDLATIEQSLTELFAQTPHCDALIVPSDYVASKVYKISARLGRRIPQDLAVVSMLNNMRLLDYEPPVNACELPESILGKLAVQMLSRIIAGEGPLEEVLLPYEFMQRQSG